MNGNRIVYVNRATKTLTAQDYAEALARPATWGGGPLKDASGRRVLLSEPNPHDFRRDPAGAPAPGHRAEPR